MRLASALVPFLVLASTLAWGAGEADRPKVAPGWSVELIAKAPEIAYPTAVVAAPDGTIFLGQDPMDMPGPPTEPTDSVVALRGGRVVTFVDKLWAVMGLEWLDGTLYVVHAPFLSAFRDLDGDGRAESRVDLITGLGPDRPGSSGLNDHVASGVKLGMDGFLYVAVGDKGIPRGVGRDGTVISMSTGGVIRVRPDGTGLEVVSTGERNPLSVALTAGDDAFTLGNDDDSKKWPNSLTHHVVGGHHGYPYEFLTAPFRALPIVAGYFGGAGAQGTCYNEAGLPPRYRGNLFFCEWGRQAVDRIVVEPSGGTFRVALKETLVEKGDLADFRPFSIAVGADGASFLVVEWAYNGWLSYGPKTGRLFRLTYLGEDRVEPPPASTGAIADLDHPAMSARLAAQRAISARGSSGVGPLAERLESPRPGPGRAHALWALDAIGTPASRLLIRSRLVDPDAAVRLQAARSSGIRRDREALAGLSKTLGDPIAAVRREAAIALGRLGDPAAGPALYAALGDADPFAAWSVRRAVRDLRAWDAKAVKDALVDPRRREDALKLVDESWSFEAMTGLSVALVVSTDPGWKARAVAALAGNYRRYPEWSGRWFGTNPLAGPMPKKTVDWDRSGMEAVIIGLARGFRDGDPLVRRQAIAGLFGVGVRAVPILIVGFDREDDPGNLASIVRALGALGDFRAVAVLGKLLGDPARPIALRVEALEALGSLRSRESVNLRLKLLYDANAPGELVAHALPALGRAGLLPSNDLEGFLYSKDEATRAAALAAFTPARPLPVAIRSAFLDRLDDPSPVVVKAAIEAVAVHKIAEAVPKLVDLAKAEPTRHEATRALAAMPDQRAFPAYVAALTDRDPATRQAGESALKAIRPEVAAWLESMARAGAFVGPSAMAVDRILATFRPVSAWRVIGPLPRSTGARFEDSAALDFLRQSVGAEGRPVVWQSRTADRSSGLVTIDDLAARSPDLEPGGSPGRVAFAYAELVSDRDRPALLRVDSSAAIRLKVDDRELLDRASGVDRPGGADLEVVRVALRRGTNRLLIRTGAGNGPWSFGVQVSEDRGGSTASGPVSAGTEGLRAFAMTHRGDARNGEALFFEARGVGCARCHAVGGKGGSNLGPDLAGLAEKYDKAEIVRSVLDPSARIAPGYQALAIVRRDGTVAAGLLRAETDDHLDLVDAEGRSTRIARADVESRRLVEGSTMPTGLVDALSPVEFADLVAYLAGLKAAK